LSAKNLDFHTKTPMVATSCTFIKHNAAGPMSAARCHHHTQITHLSSPTPKTAILSLFVQPRELLHELNELNQFYDLYEPQKEHHASPHPIPNPRPRPHQTRPHQRLRQNWHRRIRQSPPKRI